MRLAVVGALEDRLTPDRARWVIEQTDIFMGQALLEVTQQPDVAEQILETTVGQFLRKARRSTKLRGGSMMGVLLGQVTTKYLRDWGELPPDLYEKLMEWCRESMQDTEFSFREGAHYWWEKTGPKLGQQISAQELLELYNQARQGGEGFRDFRGPLIEHPRAGPDLWRELLDHQEGITWTRVARKILEQKGWWKDLRVVSQLMKNPEPKLLEQMLEEEKLDRRYACVAAGILRESSPDT